MNDDELNRHIANLVKTVTPPDSLGQWRQSEPQRSGIFNRWLRQGFATPVRSFGVLAAIAATITTASVSVALTVGHQRQSPPPPRVASVATPVVAPSPTAVSPGKAKVVPPAISTTPAPQAQQPAPPVQTPTPQVATPTPTPLGPAFPNPPLVTLDGHGGFIINGTGSNWWHLAYNTVNTGAGLGYSYPDIPASTTDVTIPAQ
jgi:hypothetical protein